MSNENNDESTLNIEYKNYPRHLAFYSKKYDKIFITPIAKKYPRVYKYLKEHELKHYYYNKKSPILSFIYNLALEWIEALNILDFKLINEYRKCEKEFNKIYFSGEEIDNFDKEFLSEKYSIYWFRDKLYENLRPDGYIAAGIISYLFFRYILRNVFYTYIFTFFVISIVFYLHNRFKLRNILK